MPTTTLTPTPYRLSDNKTYIIHDRPADDLPIRRLQTEGGEVLTANQLLQISLGQVDGFEPILKEYGVQFLTTLRTVPEIVAALKIDHMQATRLLAILSLGRRLFAEPQGSLLVIRGPQDVYDQYRSMATLAKEQLRCLFLNSRYHVVHEEILAIGNLDRLTIEARDVFQPAVERRVGAIILVHNHPSGDSTPSNTDLTFTKTIQEAGELLGIELLDHVIIAGTSYASCLPPSKP